MFKPDVFASANKVIQRQSYEVPRLANASRCELQSTVGPGFA